MKYYLGAFLVIILFVAISVIPPLDVMKKQGLPLKEITQTLVSGTKNRRLGVPKYLRIPKINVDASIEEVAITPKGEMGTPNEVLGIGWFNLGPRPGEVGSSVVTGHFDQEDGGAGVFFNLYRLKIGDKVYVEDDKGVTATFIVQGSRIYDSGYAEEVFSSNDGSHLNLITCDGVWDGVKKSFTKRLVVFTDIEN